MDNGFPKCSRLLKSADYSRVYKHGSKKVGRYLRIFCFPNGLRSARFGVSVGRRMGNAVKRNRLKRWMREAIRRNKGAIKSGLDIVIDPRLGVVIDNSRCLENELQMLLSSLNSAKEIGIFEESHPDLN
ncbi:MAG: ribonuclease P protein component [Acidobacteria bacterium]|nr:MAG: ribonuclease P protein component [Acidobacteriota bacterium]